MSSHPNGDKFIDVMINKIKFFIQPYSFFMVYHFFSEGLPTYDNESFDKPNEYDPDYENYPEMYINLIINDSLISFFLENLEGVQKTYACMSNVEYEFKRETIKKIKKKIIETVKK